MAVTTETFRTIAAVSLVVAFIGPTRASADDARPSPAEALFEEGKRLLEQHDLQSACDKLGESQRLEPSVGTLGLLASCHEEQGRVATAWREYVEAANLAQRTGDARGEYARKRGAALEPNVPKLNVRVTRERPGLTVVEDGSPLAPEQIGVDVAIDPGLHEIVARAPSRRAFRAEVRTELGRRAIITIPDLAAETGAAEARAAGPAEGGAGSPHGGGARVAIGVAGLAVGAIGIGAGLWLTGSAFGKNAASQAVHDTCTTASDCARGRDMREDAQHEANAAGVLFGVGVVGIAAGTIVLVTGPKHAKAPTGVWARPAVAGNGAGLAIGGTLR